MEIYLSHMVVFRVIEKVHLNAFATNDVIQYFLTVIFVLCGAIAFSYIMQRLINKGLVKIGLV